jgi:hypothetical protein
LPAFTRYFVRKTGRAAQDVTSLEQDKSRAKEYEWRARARSTGILKSTVYCRNFSIDVGQPASFETADRYPSAIEYLLAAVAGDLITGFAGECAKNNITVDDIEMTISGKLNNVLVHLGLEDGDASVASLDIKLFISSFDDEKNLRESWERTILRSPMAATLAKAVDLKIRFSIV